MIRSSSLTLQFATDKKLNTLNTVFDEYARVVNWYVNEYDELDKCRNFSQRLTVCDKLLSHIGSGSSRVVFGFNPYRNDIVLKLAKNQKGIAQNEEEGQFWKNDYSCFSKVIETDANSRWIVVERSTGKMTKNLFKKLTGVSFELFMQLVYTNDIAFLLTTYNDN